MESLRSAIAAKQASVEQQGAIVKSLKASKAQEAEINEAVEVLKNLKLELESATKELSKEFSGPGNAAASKEAFRSAVNNALERRLFVIPSFAIYGGVAGLYDYGPPGCAVKANVLAFWRQHFVLEENMLEVDCPCVTPEVVLKASGHVDKFTDLMVKDEKTGTCYRADHLLKDYCKDALEKDLLMDPAKRAQMKEVLATIDELSAEQLGCKLKEYSIVAPDSKNPLSDPYPFNLMFATLIGPTGLQQGFLRPETAQGIFVNFKDLYYYNGNKLPFAAAQIGQAFRNEIAPRQGLLRVREFTLAEIEHFVNSDDKSHPKFNDVADLSFLLYPREEQLAVKQPVLTRLGDAVSKEKSKIELVAQERFSEPREIEQLTIQTNKKEIGSVFRNVAKKVEESLMSMTEVEALELQSQLNSTGQADFTVCTLDKKVAITSKMVSIFKETKKVHSRAFTPSVIEPSFGIGRIIYCLYEHCFYTRPSKSGEEQFNVFRFPPLIAPIKCTVFPLVQQEKFNVVALGVSKALSRAGVSYKIDTTGTSIGKRYARTDELGVPFAVTVDSDTTVTIRERDSKEQIRVPIQEVALIVKELVENFLCWADAKAKYSLVAGKE